MHRCLGISEVLHLIFGFIGQWEGDFPFGPHVGRNTLAALARTCHIFSSPALDVLWRDLYGFNPVSNFFPIHTSVTDEMWLTFTKYARRVRTIQAWPIIGKPELMSFLEHYLQARLPLFPNLTQLDWIDNFSGVGRDFLLRYVAAPTITTIMLYFAFTPLLPSEPLGDLPRLCPNVISFSVALRNEWDETTAREVGKMAMEWPKLRRLHAGAMSQSTMDRILSRGTLETLGIDFQRSLPLLTGKIPSVVREFGVFMESTSRCTRFLRDIYASPTKFQLVIDASEDQPGANVEQLFRLLPCRLDTSRLQSLTIRTIKNRRGLLPWFTMALWEPIVSALSGFTALRELDLDSLCTVRLCDADYARLAASLVHLQSFKLGTKDPYAVKPPPTASLGAVVAVLTYCTQLEILHIAFNGLILHPGGFEGGGTTVSGKEAHQVSNNRITSLCVGRSPIHDATTEAISRCLKSILPRLLRVECRGWDQGWRAVQRMLQSD